MPSPTMPFFSGPQHGRRETARGLLLAFGFFRLPRRVPRSSYQMHTNLRCRWPVWNQTPFVMDEEKSGSSTLQKKDDLLHCGLAVRIFPATMQTCTKDTALSEQGRVAAWHAWINARHGRGMLCVNRPLTLCGKARQGNGMLCVNWPSGSRSVVTRSSPGRAYSRDQPFINTKDSKVFFILQGSTVGNGRSHDLVPLIAVFGLH